MTKQKTLNIARSITNTYNQVSVLNKLWLATCLLYSVPLLSSHCYAALAIFLPTPQTNAKCQ